MRSANSGHPPALMFSCGVGGLAVTRLSTAAIPVGIFEDDCTLVRLVIP